MNAMQEARTAVERLTVPQRQQLLEEIEKLAVEVAPGIFRTPGVCGGDACVGRMRLPVWLLEEGRRNGMSDHDLQQAHPPLDADTLRAVWDYVETHRPEIDRCISINENI